MKTTKLLLLLISVCFIFSTENMNGQNIGKILKKKTEKAVDKTLDKGIEKIEGKDSGKKDENGDVIVATEKHEPITNFINGNVIFSDNFNNERASEFPSKWTQLNGTMQNSRIVAHGKNEGVVQFITSAKMKPTFKNDDYLGNSFKIETQVYFHGKGNEAYTLNLMNNKDIYKAYQITIRGDGIVPAGTSSQYARMPHRLPYPGWRTVQLSFNNGILKVAYEGYQLINIPKLNKGVDSQLTEFTHLEVSALSGAYRPEKAMINHITIGHKGLPMYKQLVNEGRLVLDIHFEEDSYFINSSSYPTLDRIAKMLLENANTQVTIEGHTNSRGSNASNQVLSENRAKAVMNYLMIKGVTNEMSTVGYGEERPISLENNEKAWSLNRRVEIVYTGN